MATELKITASASTDLLSPREAINYERTTGDGPGLAGAGMGRTVNVGILGGGKEGVGPPAGHMGRSWPSYRPPIKVVIIGGCLLCCVLGKRSLLSRSLSLSSPTRHDDKREREKGGKGHVGQLASNRGEHH